MKKHLTMHLLMVVLTCIWALDVISVAYITDNVSQIFLLCCKYISALPVLFLAVLAKEKLAMPLKKDIPLMCLSALFGDIAYFYFEYTALKYLPAGVVTILLCFVPAASYLTDCVVKSKTPRIRIIIAILVVLIGIVPVVSDGAGEAGSWIGYVCCVLCVASFVIYGYILRGLATRYSTFSLTLYQQIISIICTLPLAIIQRPSGLPLKTVLLCIVGMGILSDGAGFLIETRGMVELGTTITGIYLNLLPVFSAVAGVIFLHESMTPLQIAGGVVAVAGSIVVILETEKEEKDGA